MARDLVKIYQNFGSICGPGSILKIDAVILQNGGNFLPGYTLSQKTTIKFDIST
jgi:hypothetical protein